MKYCLSLLLIVHVLHCHLYAQVITYSPPLEDGVRYYNFVGKSHDSIITFNMKASGINEFTSQLYIYDNNLTLGQKIILPLPKKIFGIQFFMGSDFFYLFYQHQKGDSVYLDAAKLDIHGNLIGEIMELDKTYAFYAPKFDNKLYTIIISDNKKYILAFKINNASGANTTITTLLFNNNLQLQHTSVLFAPLEDGVDYFTDFDVDNEGDLVFIRKNEAAGKLEMAKKTALVIKEAYSDSTQVVGIIPGDVRVTDIHLKIDNLNKKYILAAFYSSNERLNIDGLYCYVFNKATRAAEVYRKISFPDSLRKQASQPGLLRKAFDNFSIQNIILKYDGSFIIDAGSYSINPPSSYISPWDQLPYLGGGLPSGYIFYIPGARYPWSTWSSFTSSVFSFSGDDIAVFSLDASASPEWIKFLDVSQFNAEQLFMGYTANVLNNKIYYLYNQTEKNTSFLSAQLLDAGGNVNGTMFRDIDRTIQERINFIPRSAVKISDNELLMVCKKNARNYFAKILFN
ncbi:MAG TPA: hypothetical protein VG738_08110 [Chitinophagaceae bacterium]|nr:hypothetical protein [Chitinophagaceae bacterium]